MAIIILNYRIDDFLKADKLYSVIIEQGLQIKMKITNLQDTLDHWRNKIETANKDTSLLTQKGQTFELLMTMDQNNFYYLQWEIDKLDFLIKKYRLEPEALLFKDIQSTFADREINESHLPFALINNDPIIVAFCNQVRPPFAVVDGNHRVAARYRAGIHEIQAYILPPSLHLQGMTTDTYKILFAIHYNITFICDVISGHITMDQFMQRRIPI